MGKGIEIQAPNSIKLLNGYTSIFLGGSVEMGMAEEWQKILVERFKDDNIIFYNPRRIDWDSSWEQKIEIDQFREQVVWELKCLEVANLVVMYFDPNTKSPISLLELGLHAHERDKMVVLCPEGFWRKGNVDIVCQFYNINQVNSFDELFEFIKIRSKKPKK